MRLTMVLCSVLLLAVAAVPVLAQEPAAEPTAEQMVSRLRYQWRALLLASVVNARSHGQTPAEYGASLGRLFAPPGDQGLTPQRLARGMRANFRLVGLEAELLEDTPELAVLRFSRPDSSAFVAGYGDIGATLTDWDATVQAVVEQIAAEHGLIWDQRRDGAVMIARVSRER